LVEARVILSGLRLRGRHGVSDAERERVQEFVVDIECPTDVDRAAARDRIEDTLDYRALRDIATAVIEGAPRHLVETLADDIARRVLRELRPSSVRVKVVKARPEGVAAAAAIEVTRTLHESPEIPAVELHVPDFAPVRDFYGRLGFMVEREEPGEDGYLVLRHESTRLAFWPGSAMAMTHHYFGRFPQGTVRGFGVEVIVVTSALDAMYARARELHCIVLPIESRPWGRRDFRIRDPFGYYLRITGVEESAPDSLV
jgi:dihydroneopterin aldolase